MVDKIEKLQTPCFILDPTELKRSVKGFQNALNANFARSIVGYSVKTNSVPMCMKLAGEMGAYAEVVSYDEYELARLCGFSPERVIYNGPMKSKETFLEAVRNGAIVNIETKRELEWLAELDALVSEGDKISKENPDQNALECLASGEDCLGDRDFVARHPNKNPKENRGTENLSLPLKVGLRLNINISRVSPEDADGENDNSRFGFSDETSEFRDAVEAIAGMENVVLAGLHIHRTAHSRSVRFYRQSIEFACRTIEKYGLKLDYLDVGGGYFGIFPNKPTYREYSDAFCEVLKGHGLEDLCVIVEPGNALVASCFAFMSEVIDVKHVEEELWFATTDGSRNDVDPFFKKTGYLSEVMYNDELIDESLELRDSGKLIAYSLELRDESLELRDRPVVKEQVVSGCTCLEYDRMHTLVDKPLLKVGDRLWYRNVGAYTMCLSPMFIRYVPNIYMKVGDDFELIREKYTAEEYIVKSKF